MSKFNSQSSGTKDKGRRRSLAGMLLGVAALVVLPVAIAWACVPAASIGFDQPGYKYKAGQTVKVTGRGFRGSTPVELKLQAPSGAQSTVGTNGKTTDPTGNFDDQFALASDAAPGDYVVTATVGTSSARETLTVEAPQTVPPPVTGGGPPSGPTGPPVTTPTESVDTNKENTAASRRKAIRRCNAKYRSRRGASRSAKRKMARKKAACKRAAARRFP